MVISYWRTTTGITASREAIAHVVKPWDEDKNVMPYELKDYVDNYTDNKLQAVVRMGGNLQVLKNLLASNFVVLVEKGITTFRDTTTGKFAWMGHYNTVVGYDDSTQSVIVDDSYIGTVDNPNLGINLQIPYSEFIDQWRDFNYTFLVVYPPEKQNDVLNAMGILADENAAFQESARIAAEETQTLSGLELYMAWFNLGTSRVKLLDYQGAVDAYNYAFTTVYPTIPDDLRPWRMMWYQTGPYFAYYYTGRYIDLVNLADQTIASTPKPYLEESFYWRAMAEQMLGDYPAAQEDLLKAYEYHPGFPPVVDLMTQWGIPIP